MDWKRIFFAFEEDIARIDEVTAAEDKISDLYSKLKKQDKALAEEFDCAIGLLAWAYEMQGFCGGLEFAHEA